MAVSTEIKRVPRVLGSLLIVGVFILAAYLFSGPPLSFLKPKAASAESTAALLKAYSQKDTDTDGLPDWEESLYGTDPNNAHSVSQTVTDGEAVAQGLVKPKFNTQTNASAANLSLAPAPTAAAGSITDQFAQNLFSQYMNQLGSTPPSSQDIANFAQKAVESAVADHTQHDRYSAPNVRVSGAGPAALMTYAAAMEEVFAAHTIPGNKSEIDYFSDSVNKNSPDALSMVGAIGSSYGENASALLEVHVPNEAQSAHLEIVNALSRLGADTTDMSTINSDPLRAYFGLAAYQSDAKLLVRAFSDMAAVFSTENVTLTSSDKGYHFYKTAMGAKDQPVAASNSSS
ncbi:hypothetical protein H0X32_03775 [Patescibacteria group bacterium]|nr:hypothetical protein [Patescibacteria group bacterium]